MKSLKFLKEAHKVMHVVEAFGAGVGHSVYQIYTGYTDDISGVVVYGARDLNNNLLQYSRNMKYYPWAAEREINIAVDYKALRQLLSIIDSERPSIIHCHSSKAGVLGRVAALIRGVPCVYTPHSYAFLRSDVSSGKRFFYKLIERILSRTAITIACGLEEYKIATSLGGRVDIVENGVNLNIFNRGAVRKYERFTFVNVGRRAPQKDFPFFQEISRRPEFVRCDFVWISGEDHADITLSDNLRVLGVRTPTEVAQVLQRAHCYLSTSLWEGLSRAVIEGAACGLPLLLRNVPGNREVAFRPLVVETFEDIDDCVKLAESFVKASELDSSFGMINSEKVVKFYNSERTQSRIRSIYDAVVFSKSKI